jgi:hypothetical protein
MYRAARRLPVLPYVVGLAVVLAGCADETPLESKPLASDTTDPLVETGSLDVLVTDEELVPVEGARVALVGTEVARFTGPGGRVLLVAPAGSYAMRVESLLHSPVERAVEIVAGTTAEASISLKTVPQQVPYSEIFVFSGMSSCNVPLLWGVLNFSEVCNNTTLVRSSEVLVVKPEPNWAFFAEELTWQGNHWFTMFTDNTSGQSVVLKHLSIRHGPSPIRVLAFPGEIAVGHDPQHYEPYPAKNGSISMRAMFGGYFGEVLRPISSNCNVGHDSGCLGVGTSVEARFDLYASVFYHERPAQPELYSALPDQ